MTGGWPSPGNKSPVSIEMLVKYSNVRIIRQRIIQKIGIKKKQKKKYSRWETRFHTAETIWNLVGDVLYSQIIHIWHVEIRRKLARRKGE